jgi:hypothetical protein
MKPLVTLYTNTLNVPPRRFEEGFPGIANRVEWFAIDYTGRFWIEEGGQYQFNLLSDDGSRLVIDGKRVIDNDGIHPPVAVIGGAILSHGIHSLEVSYFQGPRYSVALVLKVLAPGSDWRVFDTKDFLPPGDSGMWVKGSIRDVQRK